MQDSAKIAIKHPDALVSTGAYSAAIEMDGWVYLSGQGPLDLKTGAVIHGTIEDETRRTMENLRLILEAAGCDWTSVVKSTVHLADIADFAAFNAVYKEVFADALPLPARTTVQSVLWGGIKVEIDMIARKK